MEESGCVLRRPDPSAALGMTEVGRGITGLELCLSFVTSHGLKRGLFLIEINAAKGKAHGKNLPKIRNESLS
jgi:hypothetical protein